MAGSNTAHGGSSMKAPLSQQIDALMGQWNATHKERGTKCFISDGAVNAAAYEAASPRICFFLKEAYSKDSDSDWSLTEWLSGGAMTRMWGAVAEWTYGLSRTTALYIPKRPQLSHEEKTTLLRSIAVVNVKKSGGVSASDYTDLLEHAIEDRFFLRCELDILQPKVIVCGNNSSLLRLLYGASLSNGKVGQDGDISYSFMHQNGYAFAEEKIILDFYHPANQYPAIMNYYTICSLYQQALKEKDLCKNVL